MTARSQIEALRTIPQGVAAWLAGMTPRHLRDTNCPRNDDGTYDARAVTEWLVDRHSPPDSFLAGDSPALERYRLARAKLAELDLENRKGELIEVARCRDLLARWAVTIRRMGERLAKRYGNDAAMSVNEALTECKGVADGMARG